MSFVRQGWALPLSHSLTLDKLLNSSVPEVSRLENKVNSSTSLLESLEGLNVLCFQPCYHHSQHTPEHITFKPSSSPALINQSVF